MSQLEKYAVFLRFERRSKKFPIASGASWEIGGREYFIFSGLLYFVRRDGRLAINSIYCSRRCKTPTGRWIASSQAPREDE